MDEKKQKKKHRVLPFLLIAAAVLAVVVFAAYRDGTGFDVLRRHFSYGSSQESGTVQFTYDPSAKNRYAAVGDGLAVLSGTEFRVLDGRGQEVYSVPVAMENPALVSGGGRAAAYDVGGTELYVADLTGELLHLTADAAEGKFLPEDIPAILDSGDRRLAGPTVPPGGLYLTRLWYEDERLNG